jgi:AAA domain
MTVQFLDAPPLPPLPREFRERYYDLEKAMFAAPRSEKLSAFRTFVRYVAGMVCKDFPQTAACEWVQVSAESSGLFVAYDEEQVQHELAAGFREPIKPIDGELDSPDGPAANDRIYTEARPRWQRQVLSASELRTMKFDPVHYTVPGFIPHGVTILAAKPKAGKSWLMLDVCIAVAAGRFTLGQLRPSEGDVLYLALEDSKRRLQGRVDKLLTPFGAEWPARLEFGTEWKKLHEGGLDDLAQWCDQHPNARLIVIDILERVRRPDPGGKQRPYALDYEAIATLQPLAHKHNLSVVVVTHLRKNESDDPFDTVSGTLGLTGAADTLLVLQKTTAGVTLHAVGRDIDASSTAVQFDKTTCRWTILGAAAEVQLSDERRKILAALRESVEPLGPKAIAKAVGSKEGTIRVTLGRMVEDGEIQKVGRAMYIPVASVTL